MWRQETLLTTKPEELNDEILEKVTGGTDQEYEEMIQTLVSKDIIE